MKLVKNLRAVFCVHQSVGYSQFHQVLALRTITCVSLATLIPRCVLLTWFSIRWFDPAKPLTKLLVRKRRYIRHNQPLPRLLDARHQADLSQFLLTFVRGTTTCVSTTRHIWWVALEISSLTQWLTPANQPIDLPVAQPRYQKQRQAAKLQLRPTIRPHLTHSNALKVTISFPNQETADNSFSAPMGFPTQWTAPATYTTIPQLSTAITLIPLIAI